MGHVRTDGLSLERQALLGLWSVPGVGAVTVRALTAWCGGELGSLAAVPIRDWLPLAPVHEPARSALASLRDLRAAAVRVLEGLGRMGVAFQGDPEYPAALAAVADAPPVLFYRGEAAAPPRRRLAVVGSRNLPELFLSVVRRLAAGVAGHGVGIVSGAARGVDLAAHEGALRARGETWAFMGAALDELDPEQAALAPQILDGGGALFSELPPGVRASRNTFPRRNRLISGASDVVLVARCGAKSGAQHTVDYAEAQGRPLLALPGDVLDPSASGSNALLGSGRARACVTVEDVLRAFGMKPERSAGAPGEAPVRWADLSAEAKGAYDVLERAPRTYEDVLARSRMEPAALLSALVELEGAGLVVQHPGKLYERI